MRLHDAIRDLRVNLGYPLLEGCCHGFTLRWLEAYLTGKEKLFNKRLKTIYNKQYILAEQINTAKMKKGLNLTQQDQEAIDINAFFDHLELYHAPERHTNVFNLPLNQNNIEELSYFASSDEIRDEGGLKTLYSYPSIVTPLELENYLDKLRSVIEKSQPAVESPLGFILSSSNHTLALVFEPKKGWVFMDINQFPAKSFSLKQTDLVAQHIISGLKNNVDTPYTCFNTAIFTLKNTPNLEKLKKDLDFFKCQQPITNDLANREDDVSLAHFAVEYEHQEVFNKLGKFKTDINKKNNEGYTLAHVAAQFQNISAIKKLASFGFDFSQKNDLGATPAFIAAQYGQVEVINILHKYNVDFNLADEDGSTPAAIAALNNHVEVISKLYDYKADLNKADHEHKTPAYCAASKGNKEAIDKLIEYKVDFDIADSNGRTPAFVASFFGYAHVIRALKNNADFNLADHSGATPAYIAALRGHTHLISIFSEIANLDQANNEGETPLFIAAANGHLQVIKELAKFKANANKTNHNGATPAYVAAQNGHASVIRELGELKADLSTPKKNGVNPAFIAAFNGHREVMVELIKFKAKVNLPLKISPNDLKKMIGTKADAFIAKHLQPNNKMLTVTPLQIARLKGHDEIVSLLKKHLTKSNNENRLSLKNDANGEVLSKKRRIGTAFKDISNHQNSSKAQQEPIENPIKRRKIENNSIENIKPQSQGVGSNKSRFFKQALFTQPTNRHATTTITINK